MTLVSNTKRKSEENDLYFSSVEIAHRDIR
jgi:hypothetical protein